MGFENETDPLEGNQAGWFKFRVIPTFLHSSMTTSKARVERNMLSLEFRRRTIRFLALGGIERPPMKAPCVDATFIGNSLKGCYALVERCSIACRMGTKWMMRPCRKRPAKKESGPE